MNHWQNGYHTISDELTSWKQQITMEKYILFLKFVGNKTSNTHMLMRASSWQLRNALFIVLYINKVERAELKDPLNLISNGNI